MTRAERVRKRKRDLAASYSAPVAAAIANVDDDQARDLIQRVATNSGVADGKPRGYYLRLVAHGLKAGNYPAAPAGMTGRDARFIEQRAADTIPDLAKRLDAQRAARLELADARAAADRAERAARTARR